MKKAPRLRMKTQHSKCAGCISLHTSETGLSYACALGHTIHYKCNPQENFAYAPKPLEPCRKPRNEQHLETILKYRSNAKKPDDKSNS